MSAPTLTCRQWCSLMAGRSVPGWSRVEYDQSGSWGFPCGRLVVKRLSDGVVWKGEYYTIGQVPADVKPTTPLVSLHRAGKGRMTYL